MAGFNSQFRSSIKYRSLVTPPRVNSGFTLVELLIVVLIIGIVAAIAIPNFGASNKIYNAEMAISRLANDLKFAASRARATGQPVRIDFLTSTDETFGSYTFDNVADPQRLSQTLAVTFGDPPYAARLDVAPPTIVFDIYSYPDRDAVWTINLGQSSERSVAINQASGQVTFP